MNRAAFGMAAVAALALGGCSMCQSPYDYQGPVTNAPAPYGRQGSIVSGTTVPPMEMAAAPQNGAATGMASSPNPGMTPVPSGQQSGAKRY